MHGIVQAVRVGLSRLPSLPVQSMIEPPDDDGYYNHAWEADQSRPRSGFQEGVLRVARALRYALGAPRPSALVPPTRWRIYRVDFVVWGIIVTLVLVVAIFVRAR